jgi:hypothetical protein
MSEFVFVPLSDLPTANCEGCKHTICASDPYACACDFAWAFRVGSGGDYVSARHCDDVLKCRDYERA